MDYEVIQKHIRQLLGGLPSEAQLGVWLYRAEVLALPLLQRRMFSFGYAAAHSVVAARPAAEHPSYALYEPPSGEDAAIALCSLLVTRGGSRGTTDVLRMPREGAVPLPPPQEAAMRAWEVWLDLPDDLSAPLAPLPRPAPTAGTP